MTAFERNDAALAARIHADAALAAMDASMQELAKIAVDLGDYPIGFERALTAREDLRILCATLRQLHQMTDAIARPINPRRTP